MMVNMSNTNISASLLMKSYFNKIQLLDTTSEET